VRGFELGLALVSFALGVRSLVYWSRRPFAAIDVTDHLLFALFLTGRIGLWFAVGGGFAIVASQETRGRALVDDLQPYLWYAIVFLVLGAMQFVAGQILGRRTPPSGE